MAKKKVRKKKKSNFLINLLLIICLAVAGVSGYKLYEEFEIRKQAQESYASVSKHTEKKVSDEKQQYTETKFEFQQEERTSMMDFSDLAKINDQVTGWIESKGTVINYPIVHPNDNDYYLTHMFDGTKNKSGALFVSADNSRGFVDQNTIIYGHHMRNNTMFASLVEYKNQEYYDAHPNMMLYTPTGDYRLDVFSAYIVDVPKSDKEFIKPNFGSEENFAEFLNKIMKSSQFNSDVQVSAADRIVTLVTCTYETSDARYIVHAKLVPVVWNGL